MNKLGVQTKKMLLIDLKKNGRGIFMNLSNDELGKISIDLVLFFDKQLEIIDR